MKLLSRNKIVLLLPPLLITAVAAAERAAGNLRPGHPDWPVAWVTYREAKSLQEDIADLKAHGVGLISQPADNVKEAKELLKVARNTGMKYHIHFPEITEHASLVKQAGLTPVPAVMIGGVYRGRAIDRHVFAFTPERHEIVIEPPVYNKGYAYTRGNEKIAHYFPDMGAPARADVVVPLKPFDGTQHLKILPTTIRKAPAGVTPEVDSVTPDMAESQETRNRQLYLMTFDLTGYDDAMLDKIGLAVYWQYGGSAKYWMFGRGNVTAWAASTQEALRHHVRKTLQVWKEANGGSFPSDAVLAARFGDECFHTTSHLNGQAVSYPLWDYSQPSIEAFRQHAGPVEYPRTWGFPKIYGRDAYAWWLYTLHEGCAALCGLIRQEIAETAPGLLLFRNTTRMGVFHMSNDHDGSGQELLAKNLDIVHLDPYPVSGTLYKAVIPRDMSYCAGLARRYNRLLVPWMQAHTYAPGGLTHVSPQHVERMAEEISVHGVDAIIWLGYGRNHTFPLNQPQSWRRAGKFHERLKASPPPKPKPRLAVLRPYRTWALSSRCESQIRNPADWMLQQFLEVWAVKYGQSYDVFELPPRASPAQQRKLDSALSKYRFIVSTESRKGAWVIGTGTAGTAMDANISQQLQHRFEKELQSRGWLTGKEHAQRRRHRSD